MSERLDEQAARLRRDAIDLVPGRLAELIDERVRQLLDLRVDGPGLPDDLTAAERTVIDVTEQFVVDVHGLTDAQFARLGDHFTSAEQVAIMFHLAFTDGFGRLDKLDLGHPWPAE